MLCWSFTALMYIISAIVPSLNWMYIAGITIDILIFAAMAWGAHMLYTVVVLYIVWWVLHDIFITDSLIQWLDMVSYTYMACFVLFIYSKICKYSEPVSVYTQKAIEQINDGEVTISIDDSKPLRKELVRLMEDKQIYLNPNLTVENVVKELNTNTKYLHAVFHDNMHTTFSQFINGYRVERAKQLLQTTTCKITEIAEQCGFN